MTLGSLFKSVGGAVKGLGALLGITGKPVEWLPGLLIAASANPVAVKEAVEKVIKDKVRLELGNARLKVNAEVARGTMSATTAVSFAFDEAERAVNRLQL